MGCSQSLSIDGVISPHETIIDNDPKAETPYGKSIMGLFGSRTDDFPATPSPLKKRKKIQKSYIEEEQLQEFYAASNGDVDIFFQQITQKISEIYLDLNSQILEMMDAKKVTTNEAKIYLSERVLIMSLTILQFLGRKNKYRFDKDTFDKFDSYQKKLISYLQMKYPRGGKAFVPGDLNSVFKNFNMVENPQNDILRRANIHFSSPSKMAIVNTIKEHFNKIFEQLDQKFPVFQHFMQEKIFTIEDQGQKKYLPFKIGRKIPETISKFAIDDSEDLNIKSPELFRVIIKWVEDLEKYLLSPQSEINEKQSFKTVHDHDGKKIFDFIYLEDIQSLSDTLKQSLEDLKGPYKQFLKSISTYMDAFNVNLLKILNYSERKQKYVPKNDAIVIKYALFNTKLVSWMLVQKLIFVLQNLIKTAKQVDNPMMDQIDLVKFNLTDLLRCMVKGSKKQIMAVYQNIKKMEQQQFLKIVKIKNRLGTPLNDAMIIFTIKQSFLICQLQLILTDSSPKSQKMKNIQFLNHFLYQLQRTPYGVLSELAVVLGFKDNRMNYEDYITFSKIQEINIKDCEINHPESIQNIKLQNKPFLCSFCTEFYTVFENILLYKVCQKCWIFQCSRCIFANNKQMEKKEVNIKFYDQLTLQVFGSINKSTLPKQYDMKNIGSIFTEKIFLRDIFQSWQISPKKFEKWLITEEVSKKFIGEDNYYYNEISFQFLLVQFKGEQVSIKILCWDSDQKQIQNTYFPGQNFYAANSICQSYYDFIVGFKKFVVLTPEQCKNSLKLYLSPKSFTLPKGKIDRYRATPIFITDSKNYEIILVLKIICNQTMKIDGLQILQYQLSQKKQFKYTSMQEIWKSMPGVKIVRQNIQMKNQGLSTKHLQYFRQCTWKESIKILNISNNIITDISAIFDNLPNLESFFASKNFILQINITKKHFHLRKLICHQNKIKNINGINNLEALKSFNINNNPLQSFPVIKITTLKQLSAKNIYGIKQYSGFQKSQFPELQNLFLQDAALQNLFKINNCPKLRKFICKNNYSLQQLEIQSQHLEYLDANYCGLSSLKIQTQNLKFINLQNNKIANLQEFFKKSLLNITKIQLNQSTGENTFRFVKLDCPFLNDLDLTGCVNDIKQMALCHFPILKSLNLEAVKIKEVPSLYFPELQSLSIQSTQLQIIDQMGKSFLPKLKTLKLTGDSNQYNYDQENNDVQENDEKKEKKKKLNFPTLNLQQLEQLHLNSLIFQQMGGLSKSNFKKLKKITMTYIKASQFPQLNLYNLQQFNLQQSQFEDIKNLQNLTSQNFKKLRIYRINEKINTKNCQINSLKAFNIRQLDLTGKKINHDQVLSNLKTVQKITVSDAVLNKLPILKLQYLTNLSLISVDINDISSLAKSSLPKIKQIVINDCYQLTQLPKLSFELLQTLNCANNAVQKIDGFSLSDLPMIQNLDISNNQIIVFPTLKMKKLKNLSVLNNNFQNFDKLAECYLPLIQRLQFSSCTNIKNPIFPIIKFPKLKCIYLQSCNFTNIDNLAKSQLPMCQQLLLYYCSILNLPILNMLRLQRLTIEGEYDKDREKIDISNLSKWNCPNLKSLVISRYLIDKIPDLFFINLSQISLSQLTISEQNSLINSNLPNLSSFIVYTINGIKKAVNLPSSNISYYTITSSNIQDVSQIRDLKAERIQITSCKLKKAEKLFLEKTKVLNFNDNQITEFSIDDCPILETLELQNNKITVFPQLKFPNLTFLNLNRNKLSSFCIQSANFPMLNTIYLSNKREEEEEENSSLEISQIDCPNLYYLDCSGCNLKSINFFKKIKYSYEYINLNLSSNKISQILYLPPASLINLGQNYLENLNWLENYECRSNVTLCLNNNRIKDISGLKYIQQKIQSLDLTKNQIETFQFFSQFSSLTTLQLSNNKLKKLDLDINKNFPKLSSLYLDNNDFHQFNKGWINNFLYSLNANNNQIRTIEPLFSKSLQTLELSNNKIVSLDWLLKSQLPNIYSLNVTNNEIKKLPKFSKFVKLTYLQLNDNPVQNVEEFCQSKFSESLYLQFNMKKIKKQLQKQICDKMRQKFPNQSIEIYEEQNEGEENEKAQNAEDNQA